MARLLLHGDHANAYGSPSERLQALVLAMRRKHWSGRSIRRALLKPEHTGGKAWRAQYQENQQNALRKLQQAIEAADVFIDDHPEESLKQRVTRTVLGRQLPGRTGGVDTAVLHAHGRAVIQANKLTHHAAARDIAEAAGVTRLTASLSQHRLRKRGMLSIVTIGHGQEATLWRLELGEIDQPIPLSGVELITVTPGSGIGLTTSLSHDLWRYSLLGKRRGILYESTLSTSHAVKLTGNDRRVIKRLIGLKMAKLDKKRRGYFWKIDRDLDKVCSDEFGLEKSIGQLQREKHERERITYRKNLDKRIYEKLSLKQKVLRQPLRPMLRAVEGGRNVV